MTDENGICHPEIHFTVDGDPVESEKQVMTPNEIIRQFGEGRDPATNYLVRIEGKNTESYKDKGNVPIELHDGMRFQIISTGPTPVSDDSHRTSIDGFLTGLRELGYEPMIPSEYPDHIVFDYEVQIGRFAGRKMRIGLVVPSDWPLTPPGGPHVSPRLHPPRSDGAHPTGHIFPDHSKNFASVIGGDWQYWSRPFPNWNTAKKTADTYMAYIWKLWETQ
ncbi:MAG: hypothetical protein ACYCU7_18685 [Acidimicrobiales bacterium]